MGLDIKYLNIQFHKSKTCPGSELCQDCHLFNKNNGMCEGCSYRYRRSCLKRLCNFECNKCSGGRKSSYSTPGCCGRITLLPYQRINDYKKILEQQKPILSSSPIVFKNNLIPIIVRDIIKYAIPEKQPDIKTWAVSLHDIMNKNGNFKSDDIKDYLGLDSNCSLILSTNSPDIYQEILWNKRFDIDFEKYGIDHWFPGHFSIYDCDSKFYQFSSAKRQFLHSYIVKSSFMWFRQSETIPLKFYKSIKNFPSILISTGQMYSDWNKKLLHDEVVNADNFFPTSTSFFFVGGLKNVPAIKKNRKKYLVSLMWSKNALYGKDIHGKVDWTYKKDERHLLLLQNLKEEMKYVTKFFS